MTAAARPRNLVVVRAGDKSLHPTWFSRECAPHWDLVVSYYGSDPDKFRESTYRRIDQAGGKWDGLYRLFTEHDELLANYDRIWLPDDDIATDTRTINRIFDAMTEYKVDLLQPSLSPDSYTSWYHTLRNKRYKFRYTTVVEVMVPCITSSHLRKVLPLMQVSMSGVGLDFVWARLFDKPFGRAGILDEISVRHTRPIGSALAATMRAKERTQADDVAEIHRRFPTLAREPYKKMNPYRAVDLRGKLISGRLRLALGVLTGLDANELALSPRGDKHLHRKKWISARRTLRYGDNLDPLYMSVDS